MVFRKTIHGFFSRKGGRRRQASAPAPGSGARAQEITTESPDEYGKDQGGRGPQHGPGDPGICGGPGKGRPGKVTKPAESEYRKGGPSGDRLPLPAFPFPGRHRRRGGAAAGSRPTLVGTGRFCDHPGRGLYAGLPESGEGGVNRTATLTDGKT